MSKCFFKIDMIYFLDDVVLIYFECNTSLILNHVPSSWILLKKCKFGNVFFYLFKRIKWIN
ncbi:MAG TPA: hypothetical protein V7791_00785 [Candidatus Azoamicus sp. OHIO1]